MKELTRCFNRSEELDLQLQPKQGVK